MPLQADHPNAQSRVPSGFIDLGVGDPQFELLPMDRIHRSAEQCFTRQDPVFLQYGLEAGDLFLRQALARTLSQGYGKAVDPDQLFITNGASQGLDLICTLFTSPGDVIFVEEPSYFLALRIFADHKLRLISIPVDAEGLVIEALEAELAKTKPVLLYTIPTYQNPSGYTLSAPRRQRLAALSQEFNFLLVADEVYHLLSYAGKPPYPIAAYTNQENVLSLGSFSKILAPGLRLGWVQAHPKLLQKLTGSGLLDSGGGLNPFTSAIVRDLVEQGELEENIRHLQSVYSARVTGMDAALRTSLPGATYQTPAGGFFFWVRLPGGFDAADLAPLAAEFKVGFRPGARFSSQNGLHDHVRLGFTFYELETLEEGVRRLGLALKMAQG